MSYEECAKLLIEMYSEYFDLAGMYSKDVVPEYSKAVAKAIMAMAERSSNGQ